jgi:hypothetical protein
VLDDIMLQAHTNHMSRSKRDWKGHLSAAEKKRLGVIEREIAALETKLVLLRAERNRIQNRATVRAGK